MDERVCEAVPAGAGGILFLPYLQGERTPNLPKARGVFHGLTTENMTPDFMARAVVEGVTLGLAYGLRRFKEIGIVPTEIRLTGGGSKSAVWRQIVADVLGFPTVALQRYRRRGLGRRDPRGLDLLPGERQAGQPGRVGRRSSSSWTKKRASSRAKRTSPFTENSSSDRSI